jgi:hypothetical protein
VWRLLLPSAPVRSAEGPFGLLPSLLRVGLCSGLLRKGRPGSLRPGLRASLRSGLRALLPSAPVRSPEGPFGLLWLQLRLRVGLCSGLLWRGCCRSG